MHVNNQTSTEFRNKAIYRNFISTFAASERLFNTKCCGVQSEIYTYDSNNNKTSIKMYNANNNLIES